ncbi:symmetrical bis(5'-nucleosyl)-tetraphosphatase [Trinickia acidisoli]|uniref:symmetrical bis(5'-nucleosyl)-tetraphosphatase n=1 Tax=Trinickia acidisoli TaxID=2767482 RepID=UPI001A8C93D6|nr:symmetrical bis(5'-nucleosyl)-tetraphosphatase [Trinickia acidisoli]
MITTLATTPFAFGDLQGCHTPFKRLLSQLPLAPDTPLWFAGDLVNRGPDSLATLRDVMALDESARAVLGNHDLHLLAVAAGIRPLKKSDTLADILAAPDAGELIDWLRHRPFAHFERDLLMVHAGVLPQWDVTLALELADELQCALRSPDWKQTLAQWYGNEPRRWSADLKRADRQRVAFNAFTRIRFCTPNGEMEFDCSNGPDAAPPGYLPWFDAPDRRTADVTVVFGHWAALGLMLKDNLIGLDSGCVWGNRLSAVRLARLPHEREVIQVACDGCVSRPE